MPKYETTDNVNIPSGIPKRNVNALKRFDYAGFWPRFSAFSWDYLILYIPAYMIQIASIILTGAVYILFLVPLVLLVIIVYMDGIKGGTPGKLILGLRIVNEQGNFIGMPKAILRYTGKIISVLILGIGYLMIIWDKRKQGLHDKIARTFVTKDLQADKKNFVIIGIIIGFLIIIGLLILGLLLAFKGFFTV